MNVDSSIQVFRWFSQKSLGICLTIALAGIAYLLRALPGLNLFSPLILAIILGMLLRNTMGMPEQCQAGVSFAMKRILRFAIVLLGLQLSLGQVMAIGVNGIAIAVFTLFSTFGFTYWMGRQLGVSKSLTYLIASGTSICGASAVIATSSATQSSDRDTTYAVAIVTIFGTLSMLLYPLLLSFLNLTPEAFGIWCGASIHEVAQALAGAYQASPVSGELASITKLFRVLWLAPVVLLISLFLSSSAQSNSKQQPSPFVIPWFIFYFTLLILLNSLNIFPVGLKSAIAQIDLFLLTIAMAAMGLETKLKYMQNAGLKPLYLGACSWLFISIVSYGLVQIFY
jgi:uncharacterized integral membrane protein (TIGR00698 family)